MDRENSQIFSKTEKMKMLYEAKAEDVEFSAAEADLRISKPRPGVRSRQTSAA